MFYVKTLLQSCFSPLRVRCISVEILKRMRGFKIVFSFNIFCCTRHQQQGLVALLNWLDIFVATHNLKGWVARHSLSLSWHHMLNKLGHIEKASFALTISRSRWLVCSVFTWTDYFDLFFSPSNQNVFILTQSNLIQVDILFEKDESFW